MAEGNPSRKAHRPCRPDFGHRHRRLRRHPDRGTTQGPERRERVHVCRPKHVPQSPIRYLQSGRIRERHAELHQQEQQLQDQGTCVPLHVGHAPAGKRPALDFQGRTDDAPPHLPVDVPRHRGLDKAAPASVLCGPSHGVTAHGAFPVPRHVGRAPVHFPFGPFPAGVPLGL